MSKSEYVRHLSGFRGVDFSSDPCMVSPSRFSYAENVWRDYASGNGVAVETVPGYRLLHQFYDNETNGRINGIHPFRCVVGGVLTDYLFIHAGTNIYSVKVADKDAANVVYTAVSSVGRFAGGLTTSQFMRNSQSKSVIVNNRLWIIDGTNYFYIEYDSEAEAFEAHSVVSKYDYENDYDYSEDNAYIPVVYSDGEAYEQPNMLTGTCKERYHNHDVTGVIVTEDGSARYYPSVPFASISSVTLGGTAIPATESEEANESELTYAYAGGVLTISKSGNTAIQDADILGQELLITGSVADLQFTVTGSVSFDASHRYAPASVIGTNAANAILGCTEMCIYDGRIFFTGNTMLPNTVFYTNRDLTGNNNPAYVGWFNWFDDGVGAEPNRALLSASGMLMVLKCDTVQDASVYYHTGQSTDNSIVPRVYPSTPGVSGIGCSGAACNFLDDPVFVSKRGLDAVGKQTVNLERTIEHRSSNVDRRLLAENLQDAKLAEWQGYLVLSVGGRMYLADSRAVCAGATGSTEYEWFYLSGIGTYSDTTNMRYVYASDYPTVTDGTTETVVRNGHITENGVEYALVLRDGHEGEYTETDIPSDASVKTANIYIRNTTGDGDIDTGITAHYILGTRETPSGVENVAYLLDNEGEYYANGNFSEATQLAVMNDCLYFGTGDGSLCCFNTDKRGLKPSTVDDSDIQYDGITDFTGFIAPEWYTFCNRSYPSGVVTCSDNAGNPHATKETVRRSCIIRTKAVPFQHSDMLVSVNTDKSVWKDVGTVIGANHTYDSLNFGGTSFASNNYTHHIVNEKERGWAEKQYKLATNKYCGYFSLYSITYKYSLDRRFKE